jgi:hypothetical protein
MLFDFETENGRNRQRGLLVGGRQVHFKRLGNEAALMRVRVDERTVHQVVGLKNVKNMGWSGGLRIGVAPDDSPLSCCVTPAPRRSTGSIW